MKKLNEFIEILKKNDLFVETNASEDLGIEQISYDSREVIPRCLFICKGRNFDPSFLKDALYRGAEVYVSEKRYDIGLKQRGGGDVIYIIVNDIRKAMVHIADLFYDTPWKRFELIGITGTKGKSTTSYYVKSILDEYLLELGRNESAILSGIDVYDGVIREESRLTTPETFDLYRHFHNAAESHIDYMTMEVSSQGLKYDRTLGIKFDVGCFLNIGEDHISEIEHPDFDDYFASKLLLFKQSKISCVNNDIDEAEYVKGVAEKDSDVITFGLKEGSDVFGYDIQNIEGGFVFKVDTPSYTREFEIEMTGLFNISNALAAIAVTYALNVPSKYAFIGLKHARVSGRMEVFKTEDKFVIVDYAHNQMSFESLFDSVKEEYPGKKINIVFGCPGKKALGRREELGTVAGANADLCYLTEEDAGEERVSDISEEIASYIKKQNGKYVIIDDRSEAIRRAIEDADKNTVLLITGKGRETRQKRGKDYIDTPSDVDYVKRFLGIGRL